MIGTPLYQLVVGGPDPQFGSLTLTRFLFLHVCVFGGGGFVVLCFWRYFDLRARKLFLTAERFDDLHKCALAGAEKTRRYFWGCEAFKAACFCLVVFCAVLVLVFQHSLCSTQIAERAATLPAESYLGAELTGPVDVAGSYDAARPEWSFRALYHMTKLPIFSKIGMVYAIFVVPPFLLAFFFVLPILGRIRPLHWLCVAATFVLFVVVCVFTYKSYWDDYKNPEHAPGFLAGVADARRSADRAVELAFAPAGIPKDGALTLTKNDPFLQGPKLFEKNCASCHNFKAKSDEARNADYVEIECSEPTAPNLYGAQSAAWIRGFTNEATLVDVDCFGKTAFAENGSMYKSFMRGRVQGGLIDDEGGFLLDTNGGLIGRVIAADASPAFDVMEAVFEDFCEDDENLELVEKILNEDDEFEEADVEQAKSDYLAKLAELLQAKLADEEFIAELGLPKAISDELGKVLVDLLNDEAYREILLDSENVELVKDEEYGDLLTDAYLYKLNGEDEPIPAADQKYILRIRAAIVAACDGVADILAEEAKLKAPRPFVGGEYLGLAPNAISDMDFLTCTDCHAFYGKEENDHACDLRAYMSRNWIAGFIADPTSPKYYGKNNDRMPAYRPAEGDALMTEQEVDMLADWLSGVWYRAPQVKNDVRIGELGAAKVASQAQAIALADEAAVEAAKQAEIDAQVAKEAEEAAAAKAAKEKADAEKAEKKAKEKEEKAAEEKAKLEKDLADAQAALKKAEADAEANATKARDDADAATAALTNAEQERDALKASVSEIQTKFDQASSDAKEALKQANADKTALETRLNSVQTDLQKVSNERDLAEKRVSELELSANENEAKLRNAASALNSSKEEILKAQQEILNLREQLKAATENAAPAQENAE